MRPSPGVTGIAATLLVVLQASGHADTPPTEQSPDRKIRFVVRGLRNDSGKVRCALFDRPDAFPGGTEYAVETTRSDVHNGTAVCEFAGPRAGYYAIAAYHDENTNSHFDRNWIGIPLEGHATSNDVRTHLTVPKFDAARFPYFGGTIEIDSHMMY